MHKDPRTRIPLSSLPPTPHYARTDPLLPRPACMGKETRVQRVFLKRYRVETDLHAVREGQAVDRGKESPVVRQEPRPPLPYPAGESSLQASNRTRACHSATHDGMAAGESSLQASREPRPSPGRSPAHGMRDRLAASHPRARFLPGPLRGRAGLPQMVTPRGPRMCSALQITPAVSDPAK